MVVTLPMNELTCIEKTNLADLEATIERHLTAFYEVGFALMQIRENRYYRETHGTFEQYCKERWGFERAHAYRLIKSSEVVQNLSPIGDIPTSEGAVRPLTSIKDSEEQREVFQKAVETAPEGKVTARHIRSVINTTVVPESYHSDAHGFAAIAIFQLGKIQLYDPERGTALKRVRDWIDQNI